MPAAQECSQNGPDIYCSFNCYLSLNPVIFFGTNVSLGVSKGRFSDNTLARYREEEELA